MGTNSQREKRLIDRAQSLPLVRPASGHDYNGAQSMPQSTTGVPRSTFYVIELSL